MPIQHTYNLLRLPILTRKVVSNCCNIGNIFIYLWKDVTCVLIYYILLCIESRIDKLQFQKLNNKLHIYIFFFQSDKLSSKCKYSCISLFKCNQRKASTTTTILNHQLSNICTSNQDCLPACLPSFGKSIIISHQKYSSHDAFDRKIGSSSNVCITSCHYFHTTHINDKTVEFLLADIGEGIQEVIVKEW